MSSNHHDICSVKFAGGLDCRIRRWFQNPRKILAPFVREGMTAVDIGCGPGFFTLDMAALVGGTGRVIATDLQQGMLDLVARKLGKTDLASRVTLHLCQSTHVGLPEKADFILLFYMVHEVPDAATLFAELAASLKPDGRILMVEPPFHVTKKKFSQEVELAKAAGLVSLDCVKVSGGSGALLGLAK